MSLGQVIGEVCEVYTSRDAHWSAPGPATPDKKTAAPTAASPVSPAKVPPSTSPLKLGKSINGKQVATAIKDGTKLCRQFQRGGCKAKPCPQGAHRCAAVLRKDRVCGAPIATNCTIKRRQPPEEEAAASFGSDGLEPQEGRPLMADLMAGPNAPLTKAFISCGWRCLTVDWLLDPSHDLADERRQQSLSSQLEEVIFISAAIDCSTKSRAREIPRRFEDGRPAPGPLRSEVYPDGDRGGGSVRENPARSLHWWTSTEVAMWESGQWTDTAYTAWLGGARCKHQVLRHNVEEIQPWPSASCHHVHDPQEWTPYTCDGRRVYPSKEEAEYTAVLAFAIAVSASWWAVRKGLAQLQVPRMPTFLSVGRREHWLDMDPHAMREWAMAPLAVTRPDGIIAS